MFLFNLEQGHPLSHHVSFRKPGTTRRPDQVYRKWGRNQHQKQYTGINCG